MLGSLLFLEARDLEREWGLAAGELRNRTGITGPFPALQVGGCCYVATRTAACPPGPTLPLLHTHASYACTSFQVLLREDAAATVSVIGEALSGWDAVETDLRAAAGRPAEELDSVLVASQVSDDVGFRFLGGAKCVGTVRPPIR